MKIVINTTILQSFNFLILLRHTRNKDCGCDIYSDTRSVYYYCYVPKLSFPLLKLFTKLVIQNSPDYFWLLLKRRIRLFTLPSPFFVLPSVFLLSSLRRGIFLKTTVVVELISLPFPFCRQIERTDTTRWLIGLSSISLQREKWKGSLTYFQITVLITLIHNE